MPPSRGGSTSERHSTESRFYWTLETRSEDNPAQLGLEEFHREGILLQEGSKPNNQASVYGLHRGTVAFCIGLAAFPVLHADPKPVSASGDFGPSISTNFGAQRLRYMSIALSLSHSEK